MPFDKSFSQTAQLTNEIKGVKLIDRLEMAYQMPPSEPSSNVVEVNDENRGVDFGFRDAIYLTGKLCFAFPVPILKSRVFSKVNQRRFTLLTYQNPI